MNKSPLSCVAAASCIALVSYAEGANSADHPVGVQREGETVSIGGELTPSIAEQFLHLVDDKVKKVVIYSGGGDAVSGIAIGKEIRRRGIEVVVSGACLAGCAHYVFLPAKKRTVLPDSLVLFFNTSSSLAKLSPPPSDSKRGGFDFVARAKAEQDYYSSSGLDTRLLLQPQLEVQTTCYRRVLDASGLLMDIQFFATYKGWIPSRRFLTSVGVEVGGFWPESVDDLQRAWRKSFSPNAQGHVIFGGPDHPLSAEEIDLRYRRITQCSESKPVV